MMREAKPLYAESKWLRARCEAGEQGAEKVRTYAVAASMANR